MAASPARIHNCPRREASGSGLELLVPAPRHSGAAWRRAADARSVVLERRRGPVNGV